MKHLVITLTAILAIGIAYSFSLKNNAVRQEGGMTAEDYIKKTLNREKIVLAYFKADWCVPCIKLKPIIEQLSEEEKEKVEILIIDADQNPKVAQHFEINTLPLFIIYKNGKKMWENNTFLPKSELQKKLNAYK
jgi:thioredoxin 1